MSIFVDTGVFVSFVNKKDREHERAVGLLRELGSGAENAAKKFGLLPGVGELYTRSVSKSVSPLGTLKSVGTAPGSFLLALIQTVFASFPVAMTLLSTRATYRPWYFE